MQATEFQIGKNILSVSANAITLQKTRRSKVILIFWTSILLLTIFVTIFFITKANQPLRWPPTFEGKLLLLAMFFGIVFLIAWTLRSTNNEFKDYMIARNEDEILVNGKPFANRMRTEVVIKKKVGQDGIGVSYEIQLKHDKKKMILSFGNRLNQAKEVALLFNRHFGLPIKEK